LHLTDPQSKREVPGKTKSSLEKTSSSLGLINELFSPMSDVTRILSNLQAGDRAASEQLLPLVYEELRRLASQKMSAEKAAVTLQPTALVHEAYLRLVDQDLAWDGRGHFFASAAEAMRRILVEAARRRQSQKRGGDRQRFDLLEEDLVGLPISDELLDLNHALVRLESHDSQAAEVVQLRIFSGMTTEEVASHLGVSVSTVKRNWSYARAWLAREIRPESSEDR
jgi:RNA polymerase sigma factor (TIGR02999 family)